MRLVQKYILADLYSSDAIKTHSFLANLSYTPYLSLLNFRLEQSIYISHKKEFLNLSKATKFGKSCNETFGRTVK